MGQIILALGSISGLLAIPGSIYLYLENRRFRELKAKKDIRIARSELAKIENEKARKMAELEQSKRAMYRVSDFKLNEAAWYAIDDKQNEIRFHRSPEEERLSAEIAFNTVIKEQSLFWFFRGKNEGPLISE